MARARPNVRVGEKTAGTARRRAVPAGHAFVEAAADFMKQYETAFAEESGREREGHRPSWPSASISPGCSWSPRRRPR
ncbi:MAG TPA: toxin-antitoxin system HicB family antitoxin [Streptomyces sp.]|uniref:toxin-antitoxin system HicB family antitoxin n=1 Tax=Streptomyces sp. TaxID=1931 RepID=UPI002D51ADD1|nr:toxin-antitoxin system HicB family antitoxin [Streptomyces sp.]HZG03740.1 toxin-antitoxin system HicB family antitoxin [Streptomyces sp.]